MFTIISGDRRKSIKGKQPFSWKKESGSGENNGNNENNEIVIPNEYNDIADSYFDFLNRKMLPFSSVDSLILALELSLVVNDLDYFEYLLDEVYKMWDEFYPVIPTLPNDLQREIYLYTPYHFLPKDLINNPTFFNQWLRITESKITLNGDQKYTTQVKWYGDRKSVKRIDVTYTESPLKKSSLTIFYYENGRLKFTREYINDKEEGVWTEWYPDGQVQEEGEYLNGKKVGLWRKWYPNDQLQEEGEYLNGKKVGLWRKWYSNNQLQEEGEYIDDKKNGLWKTWYESNQPEEEQEYVNGKRNGYFKRWGWEGQLEVEGYYVDDKEEGVWKWWYTAGTSGENSRVEGNYVNGVKHGLWIKWRSDGKVISEGEYVNGQKEGIWKEDIYHEPERWETGYYHNGKKVGVWVREDTNGDMINKYNYSTKEFVE